MDNYTKMCKAATEIQDGWVPKVGVRYSYYRGISKIKIVDENTIWNKEVMLKRILGEVYCPSIEQLMEMCFSSDIGLQTQCHLMYQFSISQEGVGYTINGTMEELLLALTMYRLYGKKWDGEKWIN